MIITTITTITIINITTIIIIITTTTTTTTTDRGEFQVKICWAGPALSWSPCLCRKLFFQSPVQS